MIGLQAPGEYPSLEGIGEDYTSLRIISPAYAGRVSELTAILQYVFQFIVLEKCGYDEASHTLEQIAVTEMHHLEILGSLIARLGASPVLTNYPPYPVGYFSTSYVDYSRSPQRIVTIDLAAERQAIADYEKMICCLKNERVSAVIARIVEDERVHVQALEGLQKTLCG